MALMSLTCLINSSDGFKVLRGGNLRAPNWFPQSRFGRVGPPGNREEAGGPHSASFSDPGAGWDGLYLCGPGPSWGEEALAWEPRGSDVWPGQLWFLTPEQLGLRFLWRCVGALQAVAQLVNSGINGLLFHVFREPFPAARPLRTWGFFVQGKMKEGRVWWCGLHQGPTTPSFPVQATIPH